MKKVSKISSEAALAESQRIAAEQLKAVLPPPPADGPIIVIEVPHQRPVESHTFCNKREANEWLIERAADSSGAFEQWYGTEYETEDCTMEFSELLSEMCLRSVHDDGFARLWEWAAHDLHALHVWTIEEAREKLQWLNAPSGGLQKLHGHLSIAAALERFVDEGGA